MNYTFLGIGFLLWDTSRYEEVDTEAIHENSWLKKWVEKAGRKVYSLVWHFLISNGYVPQGSEVMSLRAVRSYKNEVPHEVHSTDKSLHRQLIGTFDVRLD